MINADAEAPCGHKNHRTKSVKRCLDCEWDASTALVKANERAEKAESESKNWEGNYRTALAQLEETQNLLEKAESELARLKEQSNAHRDAQIKAESDLAEARKRLGEAIPDIAVRALKAMSEEKMAVGFDEHGVRKCCESDPSDPHDADCLVFHALDAMFLAQQEAPK